MVGLLVGDCGVVMVGMCMLPIILRCVQYFERGREEEPFVEMEIEAGNTGRYNIGFWLFCADLVAMRHLI